MESMGGNIVGGTDDFEIEVETRKQPKGRYMYFYMTECKRMKKVANTSVRNDVLEKWNSMGDAEKEPYIAQSKMDSEEYKEWRKAREKKEKGQLNVLGEMRLGSLVGVRNRPIRRELCQSVMAQFDVKQCIAKYGDFSFPLGIPCVAAVLGVGNEGKSVVKVSKSKIWKALASKYGLKQKVTYAELEEEIKSGSYGGDELKARVLLYLVGIFLCPMGDMSTNKDYMKLICDQGLKGEFNWAEYVHSRLIESIITFKKGSQRYLKGCIVILEVALFDFWSGCEVVLAYERTGVALIRTWGKEEVVRVMEKLKLDRPRKQERVIGKEVVEAEEKKEEMVGEIKEMKSYVEKKYDELKKYEEEKREEMRRKDVDVIYTPESVIDTDLDSECPVPQKKKQKVEKADIPSGIDGFEAAICDYLWNSGLQSGYSIISMGNQFANVPDVATLKPTEWVGGVVIDLLAWTVCYDSKKSLQRIGYLHST
ncbi:hypothetical protein F3Y22_tig00110384pilonHSYRG00539 [Hibiscus syriacus]|uniref:HMG box domain-containing protein n=1 Tax=Hibiscus syriacus TaxID=106335 RepID=A0A6A3AX40_HIBSY|nr:hypothetical protein F3Y22_tig00110384pilonHSYRG00539 [Hibiscus syriacus]